MQAVQGKSRIIRTVQWFGVIAIVAMIAGAAASIVAMRARDIEEWRQQMSSTSLLLAEQTSQTIFAAYLVLDSVTEQVKRAGVIDQATFRKKLSTPEAYSMLRERIHGLPQIDVVSIIAANGDNINFSRSYPVPSINLAERDYYKAHQANPQLLDFISQPVRNKGNGKWTFYISRRLNDAQGNFQGLVLVGISVEVFTSFYERVARNLGEGAAISLFRNDLMLLTRWPYRDEVVGTVNRSGATHEIISLQQKSDGVIFSESPRFSTGVKGVRLTAARKTERYPLVVAITVTDDLFLSSWRRSAWLIAGVTFAGVLALLIGLFALTRTLRSREADMAAMEQLKIRAEAGNQAKSEFLATMSHEIRTPLNGILGMAQLQLMPETSAEERVDYARTILDSGKTLLSLLNGILDLSKVEAGKLELEHTAFSPADLLKDTAALFAEAARRKGLALEYRWNGPDLRYRGDPIRLRQMLANLVSNAIKFTDQGSVTIAADVVSSDSGTDQAELIFAVSDTGIGIPQKTQALLFQPFSQADASTTRRYGGSGLGLSIVRQLARLMGGDAGVDSNTGQGARFWFTLRANAIPPGEESAADAATSANSSTAASGSDNLAGRILVVDDNPVNRKVVCAMLKKRGLSCYCVEDGQQAVELISGAKGSQLRPDLILMDCQMPVLDGYDATRQIRQWEADHGHGHLTIVALTAGAFAEDRKRCIAAGMDDFLTKPVSIDKLAAMLARWLPGADAGADAGITTTDAGTTAMDHELQVFSAQEMLAMLDGDMDLAQAIVPAAIEDIAGHLEQLELAMIAGQWATAQRLTHTMKGVTAQIGGVRLANRFRAQDERLKQGLELTPPALAELRSEYQALTQALHDWLGRE